MCLRVIIAGILYSIAGILLPQSVNAQTPETTAYRLEIRCADNPLLLKKIAYQKLFTTTREREQELKQILSTCYDNAYLTATFDSIFTDSLLLKASLHTGQQYKWAYLKNGNIDEGVLSELGYREKLYNNKPFYYKSVKRLQEKLICYYENNGYPFATVKLDSIIINHESIAATLILTKNAQKKIDSVIVKGSAKITPIYLYNYLGIKPGSLYNEAQLQKVNARIAELSFIKTVKPSSIAFTPKFNKLYLYLDKKQASQFDGILGILPDNVTGKVLFTGDVHLKLQNGLGKGELIDLNWRKLQTQTQDLKLQLVYPFVARSPFGIDYNFKLYKRDTTFLDVYHNVGLQYLLSGGNYVKLFYANKISSLLSTTGLEYLTTLPTNADISTNMYGIGFKHEKLDYRLNPRKGYSITGNAGIGTKNIKRNSRLNPVVYNGLKLSTTQYTADVTANLFVPLFNRNTVKIGVQSAFVYNETLFQNELYRIGGLKTLRGFDEESIYTSAYSIFTVEYRFLLEQNSYLYLFGDGAYYENRNVTSFVHDTPIGFGAGISFETKAGIFSINYALGKQFNNPIELKSGKIHFGVVNYF